MAFKNRNHKTGRFYAKPSNKTQRFQESYMERNRKRQEDVALLKRKGHTKG